MRGFVRSLFGQVVIALIVGILLGWKYPAIAVALKPVSYTHLTLPTILLV